MQQWFTYVIRRLELSLLGEKDLESGYAETLKYILWAFEIYLTKSLRDNVIWTMYYCSRKDKTRKLIRDCP